MPLLVRCRGPLELLVWNKYLHSLTIFFHLWLFLSLFVSNISTWIKSWTGKGPFCLCNIKDLLIKAGIFVWTKSTHRKEKGQFADMVVLHNVQLCLYAICNVLNSVLIRIFIFSGFPKWFIISTSIWDHLISMLFEFGQVYKAQLRNNLRLLPSSPVSI